jgi:hypothetical protein
MPLDAQSFGMEIPCTDCIRFTYYPNPVINELTIDFLNLPTESDLSETFTVKLIDKMGNTRKQSEFKHHRYDGKAQPVKFDVSALSDGTYYLHVAGGGKIEKMQIIVER